MRNPFRRRRATAPPFDPRDLTYGLSFCPCGAQLAYVPHMLGVDHPTWRCWDCSAILLGVAPEKGHPSSVEHTSQLPFVFWEIRTDRTDHVDHLPVWSRHGTAPDPFADRRAPTT